MNARAAALMFCGLLAALAFAQDTGEIEGTVFSSATHAGISGVAVKIYTQRGDHYETTTNAQGEFSIHGMKAGDYGGSFQRDGYTTFDPSPDALPKRVHIDGRAAGRFDVEMTPYGKIAGRVVDAQGKPVAEVKVSLEGPVSARPDVLTTSADGVFSFDKLMPGSYTILAKPTIAPERAGIDRRESVFTYFPSAGDRTQAASITLRAGGDVSGNEIRLRSVPVHRLRGVVLDESGRPAAGALVSLRSRQAVSPSMARSVFGSARTWYPGPGLGIEAGNTQTDANGKFDFASVAEGDWLLHAETPWAYIEETKKDIHAVAEVTASLAQKDLLDFEMRLTENFDVPVQIDYDDSSETAGRRDLAVLLIPVAGTDEVFSRTSPAGKLVIDRVYPGRYRLLATTPRPGYYVASVDYGGRPVSGPIDISPGGPPLHFLLRRHAAVVRGTIEKGAPAMVVLVGGDENGIVYGAQCPAGGTFEFNSLRPGSYSILAFDRVEDEKLSDPLFVAELLRSAQTINVQADANPSITLTANRWPD